MERLYKVEEVAAMLGKRPKTIHNMISARRITAIEGRPKLIPESAVAEYLRKRTKRAVV